MSKETAREILVAIKFFEMGLKECEFNIGESSMINNTVRALKQYFMAGEKINGNYQEFLDAIKAKCKELLEI